MQILNDSKYALIARSMHLLSILLKEIKTEKKASCEVQNARDKWFNFGEQCDKHKVSGKITLPDHNSCPEKLESYIAN